MQVRDTSIGRHQYNADALTSIVGWVHRCRGVEISRVAKKAGVPDNMNNKDSFPAGMILGGPDRAKISQTMTLKRIDYSLRMQRRI